MTESTELPDAPGVAVIVFESLMLPRLIEAVGSLGLTVEAFDKVGEAMAYIRDAGTSIRVVVASGTLPGVLNGVDLTTTLSREYPTLPIVLADHYHGLVESNVMCLDTPWTLDAVKEDALLMMARLPTGKRSALASAT